MHKYYHHCLVEKRSRWRSQWIWWRMEKVIHIHIHYKLQGQVYQIVHMHVDLVLLVDWLWLALSALLLKKLKLVQWLINACATTSHIQFHDPLAMITLINFGIYFSFLFLNSVIYSEKKGFFFTWVFFFFSIFYVILPLL